MESLISLLWLVHAISGVAGHPPWDVRNTTGDFPVSESQYEVPGITESGNLHDSLGHKQTDSLIDLNFPTYDHLENFHDLSVWNKEEIHAFDLKADSNQNVTTMLPHKSWANWTTQNVNQYEQDTQNMDLFAKNGNADIFEASKSDPEVKDDTARLKSIWKDTTEVISSDNISMVADSYNHVEKNEPSFLENENTQNYILLNQFQERFENNPQSLSNIFQAPHKDIEYPLISILKMDPYSVRLMVKPKTYNLHTMVRLMYERVPLAKPALPQHLDDPVIEYVPMYSGEQEHRLYNLPVGKYIVCGEALANGNVFQANCVEAHVDKNSSKMLQGGVICVIAVAMLILFSVSVYAIYHRLVIYKLEQKC